MIAEAEQVTETMRTSGPRNIPLCATGATGVMCMLSTGLPGLPVEGFEGTVHTLSPMLLAERRVACKHVFV